MAKGANQKLKLLYLWDILLKNTDEDHPMSMKEIIESLAGVDVSAERKSIYSDIEELRHFGVDVESTPKGYYIASREFELPELKLMADSICASRFITEKKSEKLIKKIEGLASRHEAGKLHRQLFISDRIKNVNEGIYYLVDIIADAVSRQKKISFKYFDYTSDKTKKLRNDGKEYIVSPYSLTVSDENYYLISHYPKYEKLTHFRVDRMCDVKVTREPCEDVTKIMGKGFSIGEYSRKVFSMYSGESIRVKIKCHVSVINSVIDRFGEGVLMEKCGDEHVLVYPNVDISPTFFAWIFTFGGKMRIEGPDSAKEQFNTMIKNFME